VNTYAILVLGAVLMAVGSNGDTRELIETRVVAKSNDADYYAFPSICRTASGELLCVFYLGTGHVSPNGKIAMVRSGDEGKTWSKPEVVIDTPLDDRDPSIMQTKSGRILVSFFVRDEETMDKDRVKRTSPHVHVAWSDDGGKTFSKPKPIDVGWRWNATSDEIIQLPEGTLLMGIYGHLPGDKRDRAAVAFSKDNGETWNSTDPVTIASDQNGVVDFQEPALLRLPDGTIICSLRTTNAGLHAYESRSTDDGKTWSKPVDTFLHGHAANLLYHSSGVIFHAYRSWSQNARIVGVAAVFCEPGKPWNPAKEFPLVSVGGDVGYPSSVELPDGSIYTVYYAREHRAIEAAVISLESIEALRK
jgi:Neuraminidase (sialidase)